MVACWVVDVWAAALYNLYNSNAFPYIFTLWLISGIFLQINDSHISWSDVGDAFHYGRGVPQCFELAVYYYEKDSSSPYAQGQLGWHYEYGKGVKTDLGKAAEYYQLSADAGEDWCQNKMGVFFEEGKGEVCQSYDLAASYYMKAAKQGNKYAQWNMGRMYENGTGVPKNMFEAINWYRKAAEQGHDAAKKRLGNLEATIFQNASLTDKEIDNR